MLSPKIEELILELRELTDMEILFNKTEIDLLDFKKKNMVPEKIVYCSFENRYAKSGGLAAVVTNLLPYLDITAKNNLENSEVILLTPFHSRQPAFLNEINKSLVYVKTFIMPFGDIDTNVEIYKYRWDYDLGEGKTGYIMEYYLKSDKFFETQNNLGDPYIYDSEDLMRNNDLIIRDSVFFCKATPCAIQHLGYNKNIIFHLQEWQTTLISISSKLAMLPGRLNKDILLESCSCIQTMHNTFDSYETPGYFLEQFKKIANNSDEDKLYLLACKHILEKSFSEYSLGLSFIDKEITTVSKCFAKEITSDILHTQYFAPHIQTKLKSGGGVKGVNNGMFIKMPTEFNFVFDDKLEEIDKINKLKDIKLVNRNNLLKILCDYGSKKVYGKLLFENSGITNLPENIPICVMSGRLDLSQKGYDILLKVIDEFYIDQTITGKERIKFILTPMPIRLSDLDYFEEIAESCKGSLLVIAERMNKGFMELQLGSSFGLMPSIFEPFGAAIEYMANGTLVIARNTGGLKDQIINGENGLLYSEGSNGTKCKEYNIENIRNYFQYRHNVRIPLSRNNWVKEMVISLKTEIENAITIFNDPNRYFKMILNGFDKTRDFIWSKSAEKYYEYYK